MLSDRGVSNATSNISSATGPEAECAITVRDAVANYCLAHFHKYYFVNHISI
jgi:hypothetical protein